jgi:dienelactone hydrolase
MKRFILTLAVVGLTADLGSAADWTIPRQKELLDPFLRVLPRSEPWERWLQETGELPPDFNALPTIPFLPDPLRSAEGREVKPNEWSRRRVEILKQFERYVIGSVPPPPGNVRAASVRAREEAGALLDDVVLEFGPNNQARLRLELIIPKGPGPFPVFITQDNHRAWALVAVSRGYLGCVYAGADSRDDTGAWTSVWPGFDWTKLTRRAWAASRCIDYLQTLPVADKTKIALTGHSRNGKTALIAAALDPRITAVISSSSGAGGACSYRLFSEAQFGEGIEMITRVFPDWLHPRLRFFAGRENKLPVDQPELIACVAPRPCLISSAWNDSVESIWAVEQTFYSARRVYDLLGAGGQINLRYRPGGHETRAQDIEAYVDWLDSVFGRAPFELPDCVIFPTYAQWLSASGERIDAKTFPTNSLLDILAGPAGSRILSADQWQQKRQDIRRRIGWGLGEAPPFAETGPGTYGAEANHVATLLGRGTTPAGVQKRGINFGNYIAGDLYYPTNADQAAGKLPAVIWLHPMSTAQGYVPGYRRGDAPHLALTRLGCAVLAFDQIGNGSRIEEVRDFYLRYPHWSLLGKMVEDTLAAVEAMQRVDFIDPRRVWLLGYGIGGAVALHAAALDDRVAGVVSVAGFTPMRTDTLDKGTGGLARWSGWMPLQPRLGVFVGEETRVPYDYHEVLAMVAPRPALVFAPKTDTQASLNEVRGCVAEAGKVYDLLWAKNNLQFVELDDYNRFSPETQQVVSDRLKATTGF